MGWWIDWGNDKLLSIDILAGTGYGNCDCELWSGLSFSLFFMYPIYGLVFLRTSIAVIYF